MTAGYGDYDHHEVRREAATVKTGTVASHRAPSTGRALA